jgi:hypothetical protein
MAPTLPRRSAHGAGSASSNVEARPRFDWAQTGHLQTMAFFARPRRFSYRLAPDASRNLVTTIQPLAAQAGLRILMHGGNAIGSELSVARRAPLTTSAFRTTRDPCLGLVFFIHPTLNPGAPVGISKRRGVVPRARGAAKEETRALLSQPGSDVPCPVNVERSANESRLLLSLGQHRGIRGTLLLLLVRPSLIKINR